MTFVPVAPLSVHRTLSPVGWSSFTNSWPGQRPPGCNPDVNPAGLIPLLSQAFVESPAIIPAEVLILWNQWNRIKD